VGVYLAYFKTFVLQQATVKKKKNYWKRQFMTTGNIQDLQRISVLQVK
jgi:hypothetical protein